MWYVLEVLDVADYDSGCIVDGLRVFFIGVAVCGSTGFSRCSGLFDRAQEDTSTITYGFDHYHSPKAHEPPASSTPATVIMLSQTLVYMKSPTPPSSNPQGEDSMSTIDYEGQASDLVIDFKQPAEWFYSGSSDMLFAKQGNNEFSLSRATTELPRNTYCLFALRKIFFRTLL